MTYGLKEYGRFRAGKVAAQMAEECFNSPYAQAHSYEFTTSFLWFSYLTVFLNIFATLPFETWILNQDYERWVRDLSLYSKDSVWGYIGFDIAQIIILLIGTIVIIISALGVRKILNLDKEISSISELRKVTNEDEKFNIAKTELNGFPWYFRTAWRVAPWAMFLCLFAWLWIFMMHPWTGPYVAPVKY